MKRKNDMKTPKKRSEIARALQSPIFRGKKIPSKKRKERNEKPKGFSGMYD